MKQLILALIVVLGSSAFAQKKLQTRAEYIEKYKEIAIEEMNKNGIPASITLAQGILESGNGNSRLAVQGNNHFGIKCHSDWTGKTIHEDDDKKQECFRKYKSAEQSFRDHSDFLRRKRYAPLFELKLDDYKAWAKGLKKAGYATNPKYPDLLIRLIEENNLSQYDGDKPKVKAKKKKSKSTPPKKLVVSKRLGKHQVKIHENNIRYIEVKSDDTIEKIADEFNMGTWQLYKYNDLEKGTVTIPEGNLFLQPKRKKSKTETHTSLDGETLWAISQTFGVRLKSLRKWNGFEEGHPISAGDQIKLRK